MTVVEQAEVAAEQREKGSEVEILARHSDHEVVVRTPVEVTRGQRVAEVVSLFGQIGGAGRILVDEKADDRQQPSGTAVQDRDRGSKSLI